MPFPVSYNSPSSRYLPAQELQLICCRMNRLSSQLLPGTSYQRLSSALLSLGRSKTVDLSRLPTWWFAWILTLLTHSLFPTWLKRARSFQRMSNGQRGGWGVGQEDGQHVSQEPARSSLFYNSVYRLSQSPTCLQSTQMEYLDLSINSFITG